MSLFPEGVPWFCLAILHHRDKPARLTIFSLRTNISHKILAPNFHSKATAQTEPWSRLWVQHLSILRNLTLPSDLSGQT